MDRLFALYFPAPEDEEILRLNERQPCRATISETVGDRVNLIVTDHYGQSHVRLSVAVGHCFEPDYCLLQP